MFITPPVPHSIKSGGRDMLLSVFAVSDGTNAVDVTLEPRNTGDVALTVRLTTVTELSRKAEWTTRTEGNILFVDLVNPPLMNGIVAPIKIGGYSDPRTGVMRELWLSVVGIAYGTPVVTSLYFVSFYLGAEAPPAAGAASTLG